MTWNGEQLDFDAYLARIGYEGSPKPDLESLRTLHRAHVAAVPFENLEIMLGRPVLLDLEALQDKLVRRRRGGYCYEQNLLFAAVLERTGFAVTGLGARVRAGATAMRAVTHMILKVEADGEEWLCDVGFGAEGLLEPIRLRDGEEARQGTWRFGLVAEEGGVKALRTLHHDGWFDIYGFTLEPRFTVDYVLMNHYTSTHPKSAFTRRPVIQRAAPGVRRSLVGARLTVTRPGGEVEERDVAEGELKDVVVQEFGVELSDDDWRTLIRVYSAGA
ncbi:arylamine N-acetyltransferase [Streptomyces sp. NPDC059009]|uniref:arylamine N-acetyltransferase family protein n=1 Tax=Streptomyces sp. NPDC059009 TaxID=3346694 RepID=UPI0036BF4F4D